MSDSQHLQIMYEHYYTDGTWRTRELYPWEYNVQIQACIEEASRLQSAYERTIFLQQAKIFQDRVDYLRQAKKKRNQKTRQQHKKKAQAQRVTLMQVQELDHKQEVEHSDIQSSGEAAVKCTRSGAAFSAGKHVVLQRVQSGAWDVATSPQHAAISCFEMASFIDGLIMVQNGTIWRPRMGVG